MDDKLITLNVGGSFITSKFQTLTRFPHSKPANMIKERQLSSLHPEGSFLFIDRDPVLFRHILNYLRTGQVILPDDYKEFEMLSQEAHFYEIFDLIADLPQRGSSGSPGAVQGLQSPRGQSGAAQGHQGLQPPRTPFAFNPLIPIRHAPMDFLYATATGVVLTSGSIYKWTFESSGPILTVLGQAFKEWSIVLEPAKNLQGALMYRPNMDMGICGVTMVLVHLGYGLHSTFEHQGLQIQRFYVRPHQT